MPANDKEAHVPIWFTLSIGGAEAAGFFKEATGFDSESEVTEIKRSLPNGRTDVIKAMATPSGATSSSSAGSIRTSHSGSGGR